MHPRRSDLAAVYRLCSTASFVLWSLCFSIALFSVQGQTVRPLRVNIGTFAVEKPVQYAALYYTFPAFEKGVSDIRTLYGDVLNVSHTYIARSSIMGCEPEFIENVEDMLSKFYHETASTADVTVLVSPGCNELYGTNLLATQWNILHVTSVSNTGMVKNRAANPVWLYFGSGNYAITEDAVTNLLLTHQWYHTYLVWDTASNPLFRGLALWIMGALRKMEQMQPVFLQINSKGDTAEDRAVMLAEFKRSSRVFLYFGHSDYLRKILIQAAKSNMTNEEYVYIGFQSTFHTPSSGNFSWQFHDVDDEVAKEAYKSVLVLGAEHLDNQTEVDQSDPFMQYCKRRSFEKYNFTYNEPSPYVRNSYVATLAVGEMLAEIYRTTPTFDFTDGRQLADRFLNRSFINSVRNFSVSPYGDMVVNLTLRATSGESDTLPVVRIWDNRARRYVPIKPLNWRGGHGPPRDVPVCGFSGYAGACTPEFAFGNIIGSVLGALAALILTLVAYMCTTKRRAVKAILHDKSWIILAAQLKGPGDSHHSFGRSLRAKMHPENYSFRLWYNGTPVWTGRLWKTHFSLDIWERLTIQFDYEFQMLMQEMRGCSHHNINKFFGLFVSPYNAGYTVNAVTTFCSRGSVCDLFELRTLDWDFRVSFVTNLISGLTYIHCGPLGFHGLLTVEKCLIDRFFILKIADYGYHQVAANIAFRMGVSRQRIKVPPGPIRESDIFALAVVMAEITTADVLIVMDPSPEIIQQGTERSRANAVNTALTKASQSDALLASVEAGTLNELTSLINLCLDTDPKQRPSIRYVKKKAELLFGTRASVVEKVLARLATYSERLESEVAARTAELVLESEKSDKLLREILPGIVIEKLRSGESIDAEFFSSTTVFFSDLVGFIAFVDRKSPLEVIQVVSNVINLFDTTASKFNVYKVETVGDGYMVVSGLPIVNDCHADEITSMACLMLRSYFSSSYSGLGMALRAGAHSGACAAGIVGSSRPRYCLFGDTVNVASRMCTSGEVKRLQISASTASLVTTESTTALMSHRGSVAVKGRGELDTWWIDPVLDFMKQLVTTSDDPVIFEKPLVGPRDSGIEV